MDTKARTIKELLPFAMNSTIKLINMIKKVGVNDNVSSLYNVLSFLLSSSS